MPFYIFCNSLHGVFFSFTGKLLTLWVLSYDLIRTFNCGKCCFIFNFHYFEIFLTQKIYDHFLFLIPLLYLPWSNIDIALYIHPLKSPELSWLKHIYIYVYFNSPNFIYLSKKKWQFLDKNKPFPAANLPGLPPFRKFPLSLELKAHSIASKNYVSLPWNFFFLVHLGF